MTRKFLGVSDQGTLPLQLLLTGLSANDNLMGPTMGLRLADWQQGRQSVTPLLRSSLVRTKLQVYVTINGWLVEHGLRSAPTQYRLYDNKFMHSFIT